jgi:hypothetical protein
MAFTNTEARKIFMPKKNEIRQDRRRMHDKELLDAL